MAEAEGGRTEGAPAHQNIGALLLQARIDRGLSAREVGEMTRITAETLRRVEAGRFEDCGGDIYARGHIRAYAQAVGADPEPLLTMYGTVHLPPLTKRDLRKPRTAGASAAPVKSDKPLGSARKDARQAAANRARAVLPTIVPGAVPSLVPMIGSAAPPDVPALKQPRREDYTDLDSGSAARLVDPLTADGAAVNEAPAAFLGGARSARRSGPNWSLALLGAVGAVGLVAAVQLWPHDAPSSSPATTAAKAAVPHAQPRVSAPTVAPPAAAPAPKAPVDLRISAKAQPVWIGVTNAAGQQLFWNVLAAGQTQEFTDTSRLDVTLGNAAGVTMQLNGKTLAASGADGQVVSTSFGPAGQLTATD